MAEGRRRWGWLMGITEEGRRVDDTVAPSQAAPEYGQIQIEDAVLTAARRWVDEEGTHVVESLEFDVVGLGSDWDNAIRNFVDRAEELLDQYGDLVPGGHITDHESEIGGLLARRLVEFYQAWNRELAAYLEEAAQRKPSLLDALLSRSRAVRRHPDTWLSQTRKTSSHLLNV
jgi:hypothetical protein